MLLRLILAFYILTICNTSLQSQNQNRIDSLLNILSSGNITLEQKAKTNLNLGSEFYKYDRDTAFHYAYIGYEQALKSKDNFLVAKGLAQICLKELTGGNYTAAIDSLEKAESLLADINESIDLQELKMLLYRNKGSAYNYLNEHEKAIESHLTTLRIAEQVENPTEIASANYSIAVVHFSSQNFERASLYGKKAYDLSIEIPDYNIVASSLNLNGAIKFYTGDQDSSKYYSSMALTVAKENNLLQPSLEAASVLASIHYQNEVYDSALYYQQELLDISTEIGDQYYIASLTGNIAEVYSKLNDVPNARKYFDDFKEINKKLNNLQLGKLNARNYAEFEKSIGNYEKAYDILTEYVIIQDTLYTKENREIQLDLETKYQSAKKDTELAHQQNVIDKQKNQRNLFFGGGMLSLLIAGFFWNRKNTTQKLYNQQKEIDTQKINQLEKEKKILSMNALIEGQEAERIRIAKDLHDGLGGLLATVKTRMSNITDEIKKLESFNVYEKTTQMVDDACDEVRRISHNLLPGALRLDGLKTAVEQIGEELTETHPFDVQVEVIGFDGKLNETKEVFLYRIVQEATNNIIKHADADKVLIQLSETDAEYHLIIEDDGKGFDKDTSKETPGLGLKSMQSRVEHLQGNLDISSKLGEGTTISIHIPKDND